MNKNLRRSNLAPIWMILLAFFVTGITYAQDTEAPTAQPNIMVIPYAKEGQSLRNAYDGSEITRVAVVKVKEAFDKRGVNTIDFRARMKQMGNTEILQEDQTSDLKDMVIAMSGADIYVEVEASKTVTSTGNSVTIIMSVYDAFSGESLANKVANSPKIYTDNFEKLAEKAVEEEVENLLNTIQEKFSDMIDNGRTIVLNIGIDEDSDLTMNYEDEDSFELLSDLIEIWVEESAFKSQYRLQGTSQNRMIFDIVKVPLKDENGNNFRVTRFAAQFRKYMRELDIKAEQVIQGNNLVFTLSKN